MASAPAFFPAVPTTLPFTNSKKHLNCIHPQQFSNCHQSSKHRTHFSTLQVHALASAVPSPLNVEYLATEFAGHGISFEGIGDSCAIKMELDNGSLAHLMLPSGLITSYKPAMWHGTTLEVLHTTVSEGEDSKAVIQGGVSMDFHCRGDDGRLSWSPGTWALRNVRGSSDNSIEVELVSIAPDNKIEVKCLVTLHPELLTSEFTITNTNSSPLQLSGSVINHLFVSTPDATYTIGLQGSNYRSLEPMASKFSIIPPDFSKISSRAIQKWANKGLNKVLSSWGSNAAEESEGEEDDDYKHMTTKMCRIYTSAPREFTVIDRGRRNSISLGRNGFDELYVLSPGSNHDWYGEYAYVSVGPAMLKPMVLCPGGVWEGAQYLRNPNL